MHWTPLRRVAEEEDQRVPSSGSESSVLVGPVAVSFSGHPQAAVAPRERSSHGGKVRAGASFTSLPLNPAHNLASI